MSLRSLHDALLDYEGRAAFGDVLSPWVGQNAAAIEHLRSLGARAGHTIPQMTGEELWFLYSAHRVFEVLALNFQTSVALDSGWPGPPVTLNEFKRFAREIGLDVMTSTWWSPFHHEIVELVPIANAATGPWTRHYHWPCLMLGPMLFMRAGVTVSAGARHMTPGIADRSTLYWAHRRANRLHADLAHGWGSNSSWRTPFRRDYCLNGKFHFNVDGPNDIAAVPAGALDEHGLTRQERQELLVNRCFVVCDKDSTDLFPYDDRWSGNVQDWRE
ncbi:hypothetical protein [Rhizobacter sp. LjRoot28]|uniref:hypothetical protein n=1 Tax=Rhizobacter sp. LjRoot28 TaxID=3342309 RepID=UPI003ED07FAD